MYIYFFTPITFNIDDTNIITANKTKKQKYVLCMKRLICLKDLLLAILLHDLLTIERIVEQVAETR